MRRSRVGLVQIELVQIETDTEPLDGLLYLPDDGNVVGSAQLMHGNTMNFYVGPPRFLPPYLTGLGLACLAYNRRGHDVLSNRDSRDLEGGAYQTITQAMADNQLARSWMDEKHLPPPYVIGHSNGGMLAVTHAVETSDTPGLVLLSAHRGGRQLMRNMADNGLMAAERYDEITENARRYVAEGRGDELMLVPGWWYVISANTYVQFLDHCPDIVELATRLPCEALFLRDIVEPKDLYPAEEVAAASPHPVVVQELAAGGHYYRGGERIVAQAVCKWLSTRL